MAAAVPALMYVFALLVSVRLEAGKFGLERANPEDIPSIWTVLVKQGYMLTPLVALVGFLGLWLYSSQSRSAVYRGNASALAMERGNTHFPA